MCSFYSVTSSISFLFLIAMWECSIIFNLLYSTIVNYLYFAVRINIGKSIWKCEIANRSDRASQPIMVWRLSI